MNRKGQASNIAIVGVTTAIIIAILIAVSSFLTFTVYNVISYEVNNESLGTGAAAYTVARPPYVPNSQTVWNDSGHTQELTLTTHYTVTPSIGLINVTNASASGSIFASYTSGTLTETQSDTFTTMTATTNSSLSLLVVIIIAIAAAAIIGVIVAFGGFGAVMGRA